MILEKTELVNGPFDGKVVDLGGFEYHCSVLTSSFLEKHVYKLDNESMKYLYVGVTEFK